MVLGTYRTKTVQNDWHIGWIERDKAGDLWWTNMGRARWRLIPELSNKRLLTRADNPYYGQGHREFKLDIIDGRLAFHFAGGTYIRK